MSSKPTDETTRARALDPTRSFIVQAPAGSGKTELLIQRYLTLLAGVRHPEQVVAISFTRKSAAEMRSRVLRELRNAAGGHLPDAPHRAATFELACAVIERDRARSWSLLAEPQRLRIDTVDALNVWLAHRLPVLAGAVAGARIIEDARALHRLATQACVDRVGEGGELGGALTTLLEAADNSMPKLERSLAAVLPLRDQWLRLLAFHDSGALRAEIEAAIDLMTAETLAKLPALLGKSRHARLAALLVHAAKHADAAPTGLDLWLDESATSATVDRRLTAWRAAAQVLLTGRGTWRRRFLKSSGFGGDHPGERADMLALLDELETVAGLRETLAELETLPEPSLSAVQARTLDAVQTVLEHTVAELGVLFNRRGSVDFTELALAAQRALGHVDAPSELLLALDQKIEHLLVDEFQDTSHSQYELLERLTEGWADGDGRTLFLVGDPMQSIYRFRDADMSLFLLALSRGIGSVHLEHLILDDNFRSAPAIVQWVNGVFERVFPDEHDFENGTARYHPCRARRDASANEFVHCHGVRGADLELEQQRVIAILEEEIARSPAQSIGILVQSRSHLVGLQARMAMRGWAVHAVEIESLAQHQLGQDLIGLTRALSHLGDRIAWLGVLRAPWCGLEWRDLHTLCDGRPDDTVWELVHDTAQVASLTEDGRLRLERLLEQLEEAFSIRDALPFSRWIEASWHLLDGPACLGDVTELERADLFFRMLDRMAVDGGINDPAVLEEAFDDPADQGTPPRESGIEIMTIHRAKGLEFDCVVLFGLSREVRKSDPKALYWHQLYDRDGSIHLLAAPHTRENDKLSKLLQRIDRRHDQAERARLLYVAVTRARERLHLVGHVDPNGGPRPSSLLSWLWPELEDAFLESTETPVELEAPTPEEPPRLRRLVFEDIRLVSRHARRVVERTHRDREPDRSEFEWVSPAAVHVGTLVHRELKRIAERGLHGSGQGAAEMDLRRYRRELALLGVPYRELGSATSRVGDVLERVFADDRGRWILAPHAEARSELRLTVAGENGLEHVQLDRTFVDEHGLRWIIDYKTSEHGGGDVEGFLSAEVDRYRGQLERYARAMAEIDPRPIRVALYFPMLTALREWTPAAGRA